MTTERTMSTDAIRLAVIAESDAMDSLVRELLATTMPGVEAHTMDPASTTLALERTDCVLIDATVGGEPGVTVLRRIRAAGYGGAAVMLVAGRPDEASGDASEAASLGARCVPREVMARELGTAVADAIAAAGDEAGADHVRAAMRRTQRLVAAGEIALRMQHSLNNPLAALLAEVQMLAMEPLKAEHQEAVDRIVDLCRRVIGIVRRLDGVGDKQADEPGERVH